MRLSWRRLIMKLKRNKMFCFLLHLPLITCFLFSSTHSNGCNFHAAVLLQCCSLFFVGCHIPIKKSGCYHRYRLGAWWHNVFCNGILFKTEPSDVYFAINFCSTNAIPTPFMVFYSVDHTAMQNCICCHLKFLKLSHCYSNC